MAEWQSEDVVDESLANQKTILVQAAAPAVSYEGQTWSCTSSDPPLLKTYDLTNTQWMEHRSRYYLNLSKGYKTQSQPLQLNGGIKLHHDSGSAHNAFLYFKANGLIWGVRSQ